MSITYLFLKHNFLSWPNMLFLSLYPYQIHKWQISILVMLDENLSSKTRSIKIYWWLQARTSQEDLTIIFGSLSSHTTFFLNLTCSFCTLEKCSSLYVYQIQNWKFFVSVMLNENLSSKIKGIQITTIKLANTNRNT
jgi:hypothetical protein